MFLRYVSLVVVVNPSPLPLPKPNKLSAMMTRISTAFLIAWEDWDVVLEVDLLDELDFIGEGVVY